MKVKLSVGLCALAIMLLFGTVVMANYEVTDNQTGKLVSLYNYNQGMLVNVYDAARDMYTFYNAGKVDFVGYKGDDFNESAQNWIRVQNYVYADGFLTKTIDQYGNYTEYRDGRAIKDVNGEGFVTAEYVYDDKGGLTSKDSYDLVNGKREKISSVIYENGKEDRVITYWKKDQANTDTNKDGVVDLQDFTWTRSQTTASEYNWNGSYLVSVKDNSRNTTTYYKGGRPWEIKNQEGRTIGAYVYDGPKLLKFCDIDPTSGNTLMTTYFDQHGREDYMKDNAGNVVQRWSYNDTSKIVSRTYTYSGKSYTQTYRPGGIIATVRFMDPSVPDWKQTTYYNRFGKPVCTVETGTPPPPPAATGVGGEPIANGKLTVDDQGNVWFQFTTEDIEYLEEGIEWTEVVRQGGKFRVICVDLSKMRQNGANVQASYNETLQNTLKRLGMSSSNAKLQWNYMTQINGQWVILADRLLS